MSDTQNITADIELEIMTLSEYLQPLYKEVRGQDVPKKYSDGLCVVQFEDDESTSETAGHDRYERRYRILSFFDTQLKAIRQINALRQKFTNVESLRIKSSSRFMRIGSFLVSRPFLTEDKEIYAAIGILHVQVRQAKEIEEVPKIGGVTINPGDGWNNIIIGKDCTKKEE